MDKAWTSDLFEALRAGSIFRTDDLFFLMFFFHDDDGGATQGSVKRERRRAGMSAVIVGASIT